jgi:hypothetical protein
MYCSYYWEYSFLNERQIMSYLCSKNFCQTCSWIHHVRPQKTLPWQFSGLISYNPFMSHLSLATWPSLLSLEHVNHTPSLDPWNFFIISGNFFPQIYAKFCSYFQSLLTWHNPFQKDFTWSLCRNSTSSVPDIPHPNDSALPFFSFFSYFAQYWDLKSGSHTS